MKPWQRIADVIISRVLRIGTTTRHVAIDAGTLDASGFRNVRAARAIISPGVPTSVATAGNVTITAAQILTGIFVRNPAGAARTDTLDTAANLVAAIPGAAVGDTLTLLVVNGTDGAFAITLAAGTGGSFDVNQLAAARVIPQNASKLVHIRLTNVAIGSQAYVVYC